MCRREKYLKVAFFIKKKPGVSDEDFHAHWEGIHKDIPQRIPEFNRLVKRYSQWHVTPETRKEAAALGFPVMEYDGAAEGYWESLEDYKFVMKSPKWVDILEDEKNFIDLPVKIMYGYELVVIGEPIQFK